MDLTGYVKMDVVPSSSTAFANEGWNLGGQILGLNPGGVAFCIGKSRSLWSMDADVRWSYSLPAFVSPIVSVRYRIGQVLGVIATDDGSSSGGEGTVHVGYRAISLIDGSGHYWYLYNSGSDGAHSDGPFDLTGWDLSTLQIKAEAQSSLNFDLASSAKWIIDYLALSAYFPSAAVVIGHGANCNDYDRITLAAGALSAPGNGLLLK